MGGMAVAVGGALVVLGSVFYVLLVFGVLSPVSPGYEMYAEHYHAKRLLNMAYALPGPVGLCLVAVGLLGLRAVAAMRPRGRLRFAGTGAVIACSSAVLSVGLTVRDFIPKYLPYDPAEISPAQVMHTLASLGWAAGVLLVVAAALRVRALGRWRTAPLLLGLACVPVRQVMVLFVPPLVLPFLSVQTALLTEAPRALAGLGWVLFGAVLYRAGDREMELELGENTEVVRCLHARLWGRDGTAPARELLATDLRDLRHGGVGPEAVLRGAACLRAAFPDLRFHVERRDAEGEVVTTRWCMQGTDTGGFRYYPPTGRRAAFRGVFVDRVRDGKVVEHGGVLDGGEILRQLGHPAGPTARP